MKKFSILFIVLLFAASLINAQGKFSIGGGLELALPQGDWSDAAGTGIGFTARGEYPFTKNITGIATVGYISFGGDEIGGTEWSYSAIPILAGAKYYFKKSGEGFYAQGELGFHMMSIEVDYPSNSFFGGGSSSTSETEFSLGIGAGYEYPISPKMNLDGTVKYMLVSDANYLGVRAGVKYEL